MRLWADYLHYDLFHLEVPVFVEEAPFVLDIWRQNFTGVTSHHYVHQHHFYFKREGITKDIRLKITRYDDNTLLFQVKLIRYEGDNMVVEALESFDTLCKEYEYLIYHKSLVVFEDPTALMLYYDEEHFLGKPALMQKKCSVQRIELEHLRISYDAAPYAKGLHQLRELKALYINCGLRDLNIEAVIAVAAPLAQNRPDVLSMIYVNVNEPEKIRYRGRMRRDKHAVSEPRHKVWRALSETHKGSMVQLELEKFLRKKAGWDKVNATRKAKKERKQRAVEAMIAGKQAKRAARKAAKDGGMRTKEDHHMDQESG
ncbi:uncharacterized protein K452DRAFT_299463 [Aplosporella prunicola CBS 121167]|uniref:Uncharacterized protein n=1 Tax=Aplosporella prunicola CBS 121167 TaxID=1176127 RepID=A0A6A6BE37_9PEZI|nr:uncharacterized protein K452DRAFT_299463 [Aplosporella prunicola CBS 121167]KAF2140751.1 hypothetical protein K452DRAFT_299463 [Aplosporella prunicola CBS 121167]